MKKQHRFNRVFDILTYQLSRYPQNKAVNSFVQGNWKAVSTADLIQQVDVVSCWLISNGYKKGDCLAIMPRQGMLDWIIIDFACQQVGIIIVPIHPTYSMEELKLILDEIDPVLLIVANDILFDQDQPFNNKVKIIELSMLSVKNKTSHTAFYHQPTQAEKDELKLIKDAITPEDVLTIMYTSGTSGDPKGAIITHKNMVSNIVFTIAAFPLESSRKVMSYLPFSHVFERSACYAYLTCGASIYFVRNRDSFLADFQSAKPYFATSVPRVLEKMYDHLIEQALAQNWIKRKLGTWAIKTAQNFNKRKNNHFFMRIKLFFARMLVLNKWKNRLGGELQCIVVGAASLQPDIARMFSAAGIRIREGYGMTEASPLISMNRFSPGLNRFGTVGIPVAAMDLKIESESADGEGEIWIKGPNVTQGYYKRPDLNKAVFTDDGWFKTGDVGKMVGGMFLQITDRKKDIFKTSSGNYIAPQQLENRLKSSDFIMQCLVIGFGRPFVIALIVPNFILLKEWCEANHIHWTSPQYMVHNIKVYEKLKQEIARVNQESPNYKKIRNFILCHEEWTVENNLLTATQKPIRKALLLLNEKEINKLYA